MTRTIHVLWEIFLPYSRTLNSPFSQRRDFLIFRMPIVGFTTVLLILGTGESHAQYDLWQHKDLRALQDAGLDADEATMLSIMRQAIADDAKIIKIDNLIRDLASTDFQRRDSASKELRRLGPGALPALENAVRCPDLEVAKRVQACIDHVRQETRAKGQAYDLTHRFIAMRMMVRQRSPAIQDVLVPCFYSPRPEIAQVTADLILRTEDAHARVSVLTTAWARDLEYGQVLKPHTTTIIRRVHDLWSTGEPETRKAIATAWERLGRADLRKHLQSIGKVEDAASKSKAIDQLSQLKYARLFAHETVPVLLEALSHESPI